MPQNATSDQYLHCLHTERFKFVLRHAKKLNSVLNLSVCPSVSLSGLAIRVCCKVNRLLLALLYSTCAQRFGVVRS